MPAHGRPHAPRRAETVSKPASQPFVGSFVGNFVENLAGRNDSCRGFSKEFSTRFPTKALRWRLLRRDQREVPAACVNRRGRPWAASSRCKESHLKESAGGRNGRRTCPSPYR